MLFCITFTVTRCPTPSKYVKWVILKRFGTIFKRVVLGHLGNVDFVFLELSNFWRALRCPPVVPHSLPDNLWKLCFLLYFLKQNYNCKKERENDKKVLEGDLKSGDKKKTKKDPATEIKKSVKTAVVKAAAEDAKKDGTTGLGKKIHGVDIITSMSGIHGDPTGSGLNAAAAAGVDMAK